ncbi:glycosyltransferase family A protein [Pseudomonas sp. NBRC 111133]|uniref:glycosyltransferase family 2 protein n=1 Tax=Pseudomonas sp. NBRC 111133 TaxID=1661048 RepID=UPI0009E78DC9|nr:glycosyltransferase family A protein [Pseudomonas sp. NBRC 111133]
MNSNPPGTALPQRSLSSRAKLALNAGEFELAIDLYERAMAQQPELAHLYLFNLNLARKGLMLPPIIEHELKLNKNSTPLQDHAQKTASTIPTVDHQNFNYHSVTPFVSILMTSSNSEDYIEESVTSILRQTWPNFELIVIDDSSIDGTWIKLQRLEKTVSNIKCLRTNSILGFPFGLNWALSIAKGEFIFLQSADLLIRPERIHADMQQLLQTNVIGVVNCHPNNSSKPRDLALSGRATPIQLPLTLGLPRKVFQRIGYFDYTKNLAFEEFIHRLSTFATHVHAELRSSEHESYSAYDFSAATALKSITLDQSSDSWAGTMESSRDEYVEAFHQLHQQLGVERFREFFRFPVIRDLIPVPPPLSNLANPTDSVVVSLCSIPERAELLRQVLASLAPQVDALHIYLDRYDSVPDFVRNCHPQVTVYLSKDHPGLRDNGKFLAFSALEEDCYYFTADDDIVYPPDYVASMVRRIEDYERQAVIGVHGVLLPEQAEGYFTSFRKVHMFKKELERDALVNNLGTGTVAFHSGLLRGLDLTHFGTPGMADLHLSVFCKQRDIPMVALARPEDWLQELPSPNTSLYNEFRQADDQQSALIRAHKPWGYAAISKAVAGASMRATQPDTGERLQRLIPLLHACLK